ncbi:MAG: GTPase HflX, partial [Chlamydiota bacterium]
MDQFEGRLKQLEKGSNRAFLVGSYFAQKEKVLAENDLEELSSLAYTYGLQSVGSILVHLHRIDPAFYVGKGKVQELALLSQENQASIVIFDEELSPQQQKNVEEVLKVPVIDRTELILGVFNQRAKTSEAKIQIELAECQYQFPRLKRLWTHLSRQKTGGGGSGGYLKGEGEKQIEIDRRILKTKMHRLQKELKEVVAHREIQRKARIRNKTPSFAIVGYTNVGKSTLFHALTEA